MIDGTGIAPNQEYTWSLDMKEDTYLNNVSELLLKHH